MVESQVKEEWLAGNGAVVRRQRGQGDLLGGRAQHKLVQPLTQRLHEYNSTLLP